MAKHEGRGQADEWFDQRTLAALLGVSRQHFSTNLRNLVGDADVRHEKGKVLIRGRAFIDAYIDQRIASRKQRPIDEIDPMMTEGGPSPALERYRRARAEREELNLAQLRNELVNIARLKSHLLMMMHLIRDSIVRLQREYGNEAGAIVTEALDEFGRRLDLIGDDVLLPPADA